VERIATAGIYHAWALERRLRYATTYPYIQPPQPRCRTANPLSRRGVVLQDRHPILPRRGVGKGIELKTGQGSV